MGRIEQLYEEAAAEEEARAIAVSDAGLAKLAEAVEAYRAAEKRIAEIEEALAEARVAYDNLASKVIPEKMEELHLRSFTTSDGFDVRVEEGVTGSITKDKQGAAFDWLRSNGYAELIKNVVTVSFGKGEDEKAGQLAEALAKQGLSPEQKESVHPSTLKAFLKTQIQVEGNPAFASDATRDLFGVFEYKRVKAKKR